jgi:hypothetical protein
MVIGFLTRSLTKVIVKFLKRVAVWYQKSGTFLYPKLDKKYEEKKTYFFDFILWVDFGRSPYPVQKIPGRLRLVALWPQWNTRSKQCRDIYLLPELGLSQLCLSKGETPLETPTGLFLTNLLPIRLRRSNNGSKSVSILHIHCQIFV